MTLNSQRGHYIKKTLTLLYVITTGLTVNYAYLQATNPKPNFKHIVCIAY